MSQEDICFIYKTVNKSWNSFPTCISLQADTHHSTRTTKYRTVLKSTTYTPRDTRYTICTYNRENLLNVLYIINILYTIL
jgi:hypothetical protein